MSSKALRYYNYQRCATKKMTHEQAEEFAFQFHFKIFKQIEPYLKHGTTAVDFGCGIGVINIFTGMYFKNIWLVDGTVEESTLDSTYYGFHGDGFCLFDDMCDAPARSTSVNNEYCFYNDLSLTRETLLNNRVEAQLKLMTPEEFKKQPDDSVDLIQSHMSWGWHFPFSTYKEEAHRLLRKEGILIADIRNNSLSEDDLRGFEVVDQLVNRELNSLKYVLIKC